MYFVSKFYRSIKFFFAGLGTVGSVLAIVYGSLQSGGTVFIVGGSIALANSLFNLWETGKVSSDILKQVNNLSEKMQDFAEQNDIQKENISELKDFNLDFEKKNNELRQTVNKSLIQLTDMEKLRFRSQELQDQLKNNLELEKSQVIVLEDQNDELKINLTDMYSVKEKLKEENQQYQQLIDQAEHQIDEMEQLLDQIKEERNQLSENNEIQNGQIMKQMEIIRESKQLIVSLSRFGDKYQEFSSTIDTNLIKLDTTNTQLTQTEQDLENTANLMKNLVEKLKGATFERLDQNDDGQITPEEFQAALQRM